MAISKRILINFSESPFHLEATLDAVTLKKVVFPPEAIALASRVFPVPGGPNNKIPFHALFIPVNRCGISKGRRTAYSRASLACYNYAISSKVIFEHGFTTYLSNI